MAKQAVFDTSVLVAALVKAHPSHSRAAKKFDQMTGRGWEASICSHSLAELYAVLTSLPIRPQISPASAKLMIDELKKQATVIPLSRADYEDVLERMAEFSASGGIAGGRQHVRNWWIRKVGRGRAR